MATPRKRTPKNLVGDDSVFIEGMARICWVGYWYQQQEEKGRTFPGQDLDEVAPRTPRWALRWAGDLASKILLLNVDRRRLSDKPGLDGLYEEAQLAGFVGSRERFGALLAAQATGMGIRWTDDLPGRPTLEIKVPYDEFYPR